MISSKDPNPLEREKQLAHWQHEKCPGGTKVTGFLAGKTVGAWVHFEKAKRRSFVCRSKMSDGALQCDWCNSGMVPDWRGYTPFYDAEYTNKFALITFPYLESVREIEPHAMIELSRAKDPTSPVVIKSRPWRTTPLPPSRERANPVDLMPFLVYVLWGDENLARYSRGVVQVPSLPGMSEPGKVKFPLDKLASHLDHESEKSLVTAELAKRNAAFVRQVAARPHTNGKHKKGDGG